MSLLSQCWPDRGCKASSQLCAGGPTHSSCAGPAHNIPARACTHAYAHAHAHTFPHVFQMNISVCKGVHDSRLLACSQAREQPALLLGYACFTRHQPLLGTLRQCCFCSYASCHCQTPVLPHSWCSCSCRRHSKQTVLLLLLSCRSPKGTFQFMSTMTVTLCPSSWQVEVVLSLYDTDRDESVVLPAV